MSFLSSFIFSPSDYSIDFFQFRSINQNSMNIRKRKKGVHFARELRKAFQKTCRSTTVLMSEELTRYLRGKRVGGWGGVRDPRQSISLQIIDDNKHGLFEMARSSGYGCRLLEAP